MALANVQMDASGRRGSFRTAVAPTVGVEEEFLLLDPRTGAVVPRAPEVIGACHAPGLVVAEVMSYMVETRTPVCRTLDEVRAGLGELRSRLARAAVDHDAVSVALGAAPFGLPHAALVTDAPRYAELARRFSAAVRTSGTCACHVHVAVANRQLGVQVLLRLRRWLPALVALTANSPVWEGRDSGWASHRIRLVSQWPTAVAVPAVSTAEEYDRVVHDAVARGDALDARSVYFWARLSPRYPTVEVRVADACSTVEDTVAYAGLVRALVATALDDARRGAPQEPVPQGPLSRACRAAARGGLVGSLTDPLTGEPTSPRALVDAMVAAARPRLVVHGDDCVVQASVDRLLEIGGGAQRQRSLFHVADGTPDFVRGLADLTGAGLEAPCPWTRAVSRGRQLVDGPGSVDPGTMTSTRKAGTLPR